MEPDTYDSTTDVAPGPAPRDFRTALEENTRATTDVPARGYATTTEEAERTSYAVPERAGPFSFAAGFLGWGTAMFFTLALLSIVFAFLGNSALANSTVAGNTVTINQTVLTDLTWTGIVGALVCVFVGYFVGGYNAGRIDRWHGAGQGVAVVAWTILFGVLAAVLANSAATAYNVGAYLQPYAIDWNAVTNQSIIALVLTLLVMLAGAVLGGLAGERWFRRDTGAVETRRRTTWRGRPRV